ncbi:hypothetical protein BSL78_14595 [Apostichopus japonicus]|uniref:USP domain-containing protein n=1 Tax=Stichopus japonicus TaxID=307972 RepID=A0A2G8KKQ5_STIJA|nr:hypothetical protein BSL78_14595 [Apostichopus japonicus]
MDINTLIRGSPRQCSFCGKLAYIECKDCTPVATDEEDTDVIQSFCRDCNAARHKRKKHKVTNLSVPFEVTKKFQEIAKMVDEDDIAEKTQHLYPENRMELFSVICIETSHYMAFVKTGSGDGEQWVFFDSMADRQGRFSSHNYLSGGRKFKTDIFNLHETFTALAVIYNSVLQTFRSMNLDLPYGATIPQNGSLESIKLGWTTCPSAN